MQHQVQRLESQVKALNKAIDSSKTKNIYAVKVKVKKLQTKIQSEKFYNFLAQ